MSFSETSTAQFIVALAKKTARSGRGAAELLSGLADVNVPTNAVSRAFVGELMTRSDQGMEGGCSFIVLSALFIGSIL